MIFDLIQDLIRGADIKDVLPGMIFTVIVVLFSLSFHEMSHGFMAWKMGDPTARNMGRLTLDPSKHLDPIGTISMLLFGFGWAKPVPVVARNFKKPRKGMALTALAGPVSNILLSFAALIILRVILAFSDPAYMFLASGFSSQVIADQNIGIVIVCLIAQLLMYFHLLNIYLAVFNLIPIPPLDGSRILFIFLPDKIYFGIMKYERIIMIAMLLLLWRGYLSYPLQFLAGGLSSGMNALLNLIPGL